VKRYVFYFISAVAGLAGFLVGLCGVVYATGTLDEPARSNWWRVVSIGMIIMGLSMYPYRNQMPDYVPDLARRLAPAYALFWIILGVVVFLLSWL
jgi:hypothetical protein